MRHPWRIVAIASSVIAVGALALVVRTLNTAGVFSTVTPDFAGTCTAVPGITGGEDIAVDRRAGLAFVAATDRRPGHHARGRDGLYLLRIDHPELGAVRLSGTAKDFHPLGISLYRGGDGSLTLMAINRRLSGTPSVDIFDVTLGQTADGAPTASLKERASVRSSALFSPNDIAAVGKNRFYVTNDHMSRTSFGRLLETYLMLPRANVVYYNGDFPHVVANGLRYANGIAVSHDGRELYVSETLGREIRTYDIQPVSGALTLAADFSMPDGLDNLDVDADGNLWVAGHPKLFAFADYARDPSKPSPSEVFRVTTVNGLPAHFTRIYSGLGQRIGAASVGVYVGDHLLIGSVFDTKILDCKLL